MKNIIDYVREYGDRSFCEKPFNDVDSLILCQLAYMDFKGMVPDVEEDQPWVLLQEVGHHMLREKIFLHSVGEKENRKLFALLEKSRRFAQMGMNYHVDDLNLLQEKQFSAISFRWEDTFYIAYRGTDQYLASWKEDFNMTHQSTIPAQLEALKYIEKVGCRAKGKLMVGGHSKGGNLALYACIYCAKSIRDKLTAIYSHDGPGMRPEIYAEEVYRQLVPIIRKTIPPSSIVGLLLYQREKSKIIHSSSYSMGQHNPFSWTVEKGEFRPYPNLRKDALAKDCAFKRWLQQTNDESRKLFVDTIYQIISATGAVVTSDLKKNIWTKAMDALESSKDIDENSRETMKEVLRTLMRNLRDSYKE